MFFSVYFPSANHGTQEAKCLNSLHSFPWSGVVGKFSHKQQGMEVSGKANRHQAILFEFHHLSIYTFSVPGSIPNITLYLVILSPWSLVSDIFSVFPIFMILTYMRSAGQGFCRVSFSAHCLMFSL